MRVLRSILTVVFGLLLLGNLFGEGAQEKKAEVVDVS
jgi:hypothetical protein